MRTAGATPPPMLARTAACCTAKVCGWFFPGTVFLLQRVGLDHPSSAHLEGSTRAVQTRARLLPALMVGLDHTSSVRIEGVGNQVDYTHLREAGLAYGWSNPTPLGGSNAGTSAARLEGRTRVVQCHTSRGFGCLTIRSGYDVILDYRRPSRCRAAGGGGEPHVGDDAAHCRRPAPPGLRRLEFGLGGLRRRVRGHFLVAMPDRFLWCARAYGNATISRAYGGA